MTQDHNSEWSSRADGRDPVRECPSFETLSLSFDDELEADDAARIGEHVAGCASCQAVLRDLRLLRQGLIQTTPPSSRRSFKLSEADVAGVRPARAPAAEEAYAPTPISRRTRLLTIPFAPALAAVAAVLLIALIAGDMFSRDNGSQDTPTPTIVSAEVLVVGGTPVVVTDDDRQGSFDAASSDDTDEGGASIIPAQETAASDDNAFWTWWRIGEVLLVVILIGLVATILLQRRVHRT